MTDDSKGGDLSLITMIINYNTQQGIKYLPNNRFSAIYEMLKISPSWDIAGEVVNGKPITDEEIRFVSVKSGVICG